MKLKIFFISIFTYILQSCNPGYQVEGGQIWIREYNIGNPYKKVERDTLTILEVRGDFALYECNGKILSDRKYWITVNSYLWRR